MINDLSTAISIISIVLLPSLFIFILYRFLIEVFISISLSIQQAAIITLFIIISTFFPNILFPLSDPIILFNYSYWEIGIHPIGFVMPVLISSFLLYKKKPSLYFLLALIPVSLMAYISTSAVVNKGIVSPFPLFLFPSIMAATIPVLAKEKFGEQTCLYAFSLAVFGIIIGGDIGHFSQLINNHTIYSSIQAIFGGASGFDLILLSGIFAVLFVKLFFYLIEFFKINQYEIINHVNT